MAIPYLPTVSEICHTALRRSGQPAPSGAMVGDAMRHQFQEVKNDIRLNAGTHDLLQTSEVTVTVVGQRQYDQPSKVNKVKSVLLFDGPDEWRGTAQAGASTTITLAATTDESEDNVQGKMIFTLGGTGSLQWRFITAYNNTTKVATIHTAWTTTPSSDTTYLIANYQDEIFNRSKQEIDYQRYDHASLTVPTRASIEGEEIWMDVAPDKIYPLQWTYWQDINQMDEDSDQFKKILREWRNIFTEGVTAKSMELNDDVRQFDKINIYKFMLDRLRSESLEVTQTVPYDPTF